ncbi:hypothetical protein BGZ60DRAFT_531106 [Tricladium varicosporioides]|nr:hypothetical protein BGZ60DRAFT_531106 [Hymenoscyphus varicosporioides]
MVTPTIPPTRTSTPPSYLANGTPHNLSSTEFRDAVSGGYVLENVTVGEVLGSEARHEKTGPKYGSLRVLTSFPLFQKLPTELRHMIWKMTLTPRVVEIEFSQRHGFYSQNPLPIALKACQDSRIAVSSLYPCCFGNFIYTRQIVFNGMLDTLYISFDMQHQILHLFASLTLREAAQLQYLAIYSGIDEDDWETDIHAPEMLPTNVLRKVAPKLTSLREILVVFNILSCECGHFNISHGNSTMELVEEWPKEIIDQHECVELDIITGDVGVHELPLPPLEFEQINAPKVASIWGWRPVKD